MRLTFLGTGTSFGIPVVGCPCSTCRSPDPRDRRGRHGAVVELPEGNLLVDTPPELRLLMLQAGVEMVDAVWYTHLHADHVHGIDDLRIFSARMGESLPVLIAADHEQELHSRFPYIFDPNTWVAPETSVPGLKTIPFRAGGPLELLGAEVVPVEVPHGEGSVYGFRVGALGYVTDGKRLPPEAFRVLQGVDTLVLNALWWGDPHPTHFNVEEAVETARNLGARRTFLTHMTHRVSHADLLEDLPEGVEPAYDGLTVDIPAP